MPNDKTRPNTFFTLWISLILRGLKKPASGKWNKTVCQSYYRSKILNQKQFELCKKRLSYMKYIAEAVELTISECLKQAKYELWDCKAILKYPKFSPDIREGKRNNTGMLTNRSIYSIYMMYKFQLLLYTYMVLFRPSVSRQGCHNKDFGIFTTINYCSRDALCRKMPVGRFMTDLALSSSSLSQRDNHVNAALETVIFYK